MFLRRSRLLAAALTCGLVTTLVGCNASESPDAAPEPGTAASGDATSDPSESGRARGPARDDHVERREGRQ